MAAAVIVPRLGWSMEEGTFLEWLKQDGELVRPGDALFVLESEKAAEQIEAIDGGILRIPSESPKPGSKVLVGQVLAHLMEEGETAPASAVVAAVEKIAPAPPPIAAGPAARRLARKVNSNATRVPAPAPVTRTSEIALRQQPTNESNVKTKVAITPRAKRVAREMGIEVNGLHGTGRNGRIRERDVRTIEAAATAKLIPHTPTRRFIAARMVAGVTIAAPVTLTLKADAENLVKLREQFRSSTAADGFVPSYNEMFLKLAAVALRQHPLLQMQWRDEGLFNPERTDIALAVDADTGLVAPVIRGVDRLSLRDVATKCRETIELARAGSLTGEYLRDATFTITNLGGFGVEAFTPIITLPQSAVLGLGNIVQEPAVVDGVLVPRRRMTLSLTFDHRVMDGAPAARFLDTLRGAIEEPVPCLLS